MSVAIFFQLERRAMANGVLAAMMRIYLQEAHNTIYVHSDTQSFRLHNSDPYKAHKICQTKTCHHFQNGQLYKCGQSALFPEFYQQFDIKATAEEVKIMHGYRPGTVTQTDAELEIFLENLKDPIDQCRFCPENYQLSHIKSRAQKIRFQRRDRAER